MTTAATIRPIEHANCALRRAIMIAEPVVPSRKTAIATGGGILFLGGLAMVAMHQRANLGYYWQLLMELCA